MLINFFLSAFFIKVFTYIYGIPNFFGLMCTTIIDEDDYDFLESVDDVMLWYFLLLPFCSFCFLFFKNVVFDEESSQDDKYLIQYFLTISILYFFYSLYIYYIFALEGYVINIKCGLWFDFGLITVEWGLLFDT